MNALTLKQRAGLKQAIKEDFDGRFSSAVSSDPVIRERISLTLEQIKFLRESGKELGRRAEQIQLKVNEQAIKMLRQDQQQKLRALIQRDDSSDEKSPAAAPGFGDSGSGEGPAAVRARMARQVYIEYLHELDRMREQAAALQGKLGDAENSLRRTSEGSLPAPKRAELEREVEQLRKQRGIAEAQLRTFESEVAAKKKEAGAEEVPGTVSESVPATPSTPDVSGHPVEEKDLIEMFHEYATMTGGAFPKSLDYMTASAAFWDTYNVQQMWEDLQSQRETIAPGSAKAVERAAAVVRRAGIDDHGRDEPQHDAREALR